MRIDPREVFAFRLATRSPLSGPVPATYPLLRAHALVHPLLRPTVEAPEGAKHALVNCNVILRRPLPLRTALRLTASPSPPGHGTVPCVGLELSSAPDGEILWRAVVERRHVPRNGPDVLSGANGDTNDPATTMGYWSLTPAMARRYQQLRGDVAVTPTLSHGPAVWDSGLELYLAARMLASLSWDVPETYRFRVEFWSPIRLLSRLRYRARRHAAGWHLALQDTQDGHTMVTGTVDSLT